MSDEEDDTVPLPALNEYIDLETYDVVTGERHRKIVKELEVENAELRLTVRILADKVELLTTAEPWPMPERTADPIPPDTWGD